MDLFSLMGIAPTAPTEEKKATPKKEAPKKNTPTATPKEEKKFKLPLKVVAGLWSTEITGDGEKTLAEIKDILVEKGFTSVRSANFASSSDEGVILCGLPQSTSADAMTLVKSAADTLVVEAGEFRYEFDGDVDSAKVATVKEAFIECNPEYQGCHLNYNVAYGVFTPVGGKPEDIEADTAYEIIFNGDVVQLKGSEIAGYLGCPASADKLKVMPIDGKYLVAVDVKDEVRGKGSSSTASKPVPKKEEPKKFKLPATVTFTHTADKTITAEMFGGKEEIEEKELQEWLLNQYEEYTADKTEFLYFKKDNIIEARIKSSKRG